MGFRWEAGNWPQRRALWKSHSWRIFFRRAIQYLRRGNWSCPQSWAFHYFISHVVAHRDHILKTYSVEGEFSRQQDPLVMSVSGPQSTRVPSVSALMLCAVSQSSNTEGYRSFHTPGSWLPLRKLFISQSNFSRITRHCRLPCLSRCPICHCCHVNPGWWTWKQNQIDSGRMSKLMAEVETQQATQGCT